ncbi:MAG: hypothetical protein KIS78_28335 [Labilithrix sp.]|nr:hypothetical protein [Labilithrix sp.]MCW5836341.1 hypothetical protein [Labilithrix sp.]
MWNLPDALRDTSSVVAELEHARAHGAKALRARVDLMATASLLLRSRPETHPDALALAELAREIRDEAVELRRRHRLVRGSVLAMID